MKVFAHIVGALSALVVTLYPLTLHDELVPIVYLAGLALIGFALALLSNEWVLAGPGAAALTAEYAVALEGNTTSFDQAAPVLAIGALVVLETIDLITVITRRPAPARAVIVAHVRHVVVVILIGTAVSAAVMLAAQTAGGGPAPLAALAALCGLLAIVIAVALAYRSVEG